MQQKANTLKSLFIEKFDSSPLMVKSPGRINLIGEHTDYNMGYALPAAIDMAVYVAIQKNDTNECKMIALDLEEAYEFSVGESLKPCDVAWANYFFGVIQEFSDRGVDIGGFDMIFTSDIPSGAGLSSSAALESSFGLALSELFSANFPLKEIARIGQAAEHKFAGVKCGIMDQVASCLGKKDHVMLLDCESQEHLYISSGLSDYQLVLFDTHVKHNLADSQYNIRRKQCETGVKALQEKYSQTTSLRHATLDQLYEVQNEMDAVIYDGCKYIIEENERVLQACNALKQGDIKALGTLLFESHEGLSNLYEVSCVELDALVALANANEHILGARMMGGGFGGCTINLIKTEHKEEVIAQILHQYQVHTQQTATAYSVQISNGAMKI